ncbi:MAG: ABC transporter ATP-binding protein [Alphaproteobacteria bacterium]|nr:ABC transporter ATP-binding protein [Alphaproteobacteria bacterium]
MAIKLELVNLRKEYGALVAVNDVSLKVEEGETMALLGPSGCGKSTTLNMIVGLETPTSGDILIDGQSVSKVPVGRRNVGLVFQDYAVFTHMTVRANLEYGLKVRKVGQSEINQQVDKMASFVGLADKLHRKPGELSASEMQRVAIGRTLVCSPQILLLDEPLSNLESEMRHQMRRELHRIQLETKQTIIYVTHDQIEALSLAHRIAVMNLGVLQQYDTSYNVYHYPRSTFVGSFLGNPPMNFIKGTLKTAGGQRMIEQDGARIPLPSMKELVGVSDGAAVTVGIRAETADIVPIGSPGSFEAELFAIEPQGPEAVVTAKFASTLLKVVVPTSAVPKSSSGSIALLPHANLLALFDTQSGVRLMNGAAS